MRYFSLFCFLLFCTICNGQSFDSIRYSIEVRSDQKTDQYFKSDPIWRGADGASSIDLGNGKILWLFSDTFICADTTGSRKNSKIVRNSIGIQQGYDLKTGSVKYYWDQSKKEPDSYFQTKDDTWFWTGHGVMIREKLVVFLMKVRSVNTGFGFEAYGWCAVLISNPRDEPSAWKMKYLEGPDTFGLIAGSAAVIKDEQFIYAYGAVEPAAHEVYLLRFKADQVYDGNIATPEWWIYGKWSERIAKDPVPTPLFIGGTEFSVHYDRTIKKYIQVQSFGFGDSQIGLRMSDSLQGPWTTPYLFYKPDYSRIKKPFMYAAKAHPEIHGDGICITYNINSFDFGELIENQNLYFPGFISVKVIQNKRK